MAKDERNNTYTKIIATALEMFNENGERNVSTNHIAAKLGISPGNFYYHFRNKDEIIVLLYRRYNAAMMDSVAKQPHTPDIPGIISYLKSVFDIMWEYRFLFTDVNTLLARSAEFSGEHSEFTREKVAPFILDYLMNLVENQVLSGSREEMQELCINIWIVAKYWFDFDSSMRQTKLTEDTKLLGVHRVLTLMYPYLQEPYKHNILNCIQNHAA